MKYRHSFHAGNFADVHKHVALLALLAALKRKDKGFLYLETHAARGAYSVPARSTSGGGAHESEGGIARIVAARLEAQELRHYVDRVAAFRAARGNPRAYPGSPLLAASELRLQDRGIAIEILAPEARALELTLGAGSPLRVECGDGFERIRAHLPPQERRGLTFVDPPYEDTRRDFERVLAAVSDAAHRFASGIVCAWYPIKDERTVTAWKTAFTRASTHEVLFNELWLYPRDSRVGLNGSGLAIVNPPFQFAARADVWLPELHRQLDVARRGGTASVLVRPAAVSAGR
jgi:23S rRNA (adenine2030-N6)-methyltransferase